jgi:hypothetical protein
MMPMPADNEAIYTSRIIKAGALLADTRTMLEHWDLSQPVAENLDRLRRENVFGKASRSRVEDMLVIFRQRYLTSPAVTAALVTLVRNRLPAEALDRIFYFHAAQSDLLLHDTVTAVLSPMHAAGVSSVATGDVKRAVSEWVTEGKTAGRWGEATVERVAQGLMATLRDFGVLQGAVNKRLAPLYLPVEAFAYIAFYLQGIQPSGERLVNHPDWRLFFLSPAAVERFLMEAHQQHLLTYHAAGSIIRIEFPAESLEAYADVISQRSY